VPPPPEQDRLTEAPDRGEAAGRPESGSVRPVSLSHQQRRIADGPCRPFAGRLG